MSALARRVLVIDDEQGVLDAYRASLASKGPGAEAQGALQSLGDSLFGPSPAAGPGAAKAGKDKPGFELTLAHQGEEAIGLVRAATAENKPFSVAFIDVRMPPGLDGVETAKAIWEIDPAVFIVFVTAYSDVDVETAAEGQPDAHKLLYLAKPFQPNEIRRHAEALSSQWDRERTMKRIFAEREAALAEAHRRAEAGERAKYTFLTNLNHQLRTPLNAIIGFSGIIADGKSSSADPRHADYAREIGKAGGDLLSTVTDLIEFANLDAGAIELACDDIDLTRTIANALGEMKGFAASRDVVLAPFAPPGPVTMYADEDRTLRLLRCLLHNAIRFTPEGGCVGAGVTQSETSVTVTVWDTGPGIAPEIAETVQQPFRQGDEGRNRGYEGLGLGLAIAKRLTELHGGALTVEGAPGEGTRVRLEFPRG